MWPSAHMKPSISFAGDDFLDFLDYAGDDFLDLEKLNFLRFHGLDKQGRLILAISGKSFPGNTICKKRLLQFMACKIRHECMDMSFVVVYFESYVTGKNNPGILRWIYEGLPKDLKQNLEAVYFVHPRLQSRVWLCMLALFCLSEGLYWKIRYVSRVEFLWEHMRKNQIEIPGFVKEDEMELEYRPLMNYGIDASPLLATQGDVPAYFFSLM